VSAELHEDDYEYEPPTGREIAREVLDDDEYRQWSKDQQRRGRTWA
jgi:hypothetical protein